MDADAYCRRCGKALDAASFPDGPDSFEVDCPACGATCEFPRAGDVTCPACTWDLTIDSGGEIVDGYPISSICPHCREALTVRYAGTATCPVCGQRFVASEAVAPVAKGGRSGLSTLAIGCVVIIVGSVVLAGACAVVVGVAISTNPKSKALLTGDAADVIVQVSGGTTDGFAGSVGSLAGQRSVQGVSPASFTVSGKDSSGIITAFIQSKGRFVSTPLSVALIGCPDGNVHSGSTSADFGVVTVSC